MRELWLKGDSGMELEGAEYLVVRDVDEEEEKGSSNREEGPHLNNLQIKCLFSGKIGLEDIEALTRLSSCILPYRP